MSEPADRPDDPGDRSIDVTQVTYREAIIRALADELAADQRVLVLGEDIAAAGGVFKTTEGLVERFGSERVLDTPIAEQAIVGAAIGAAASGLRPVAELMFADFAGVCFDQLVNQLAKLRYMSAGQVSVPVTIRLINGAGSGFGAQHSQTAENWFLNVPGLKICLPATPADAYGLLRAAIQDPDPVLVFEHKGLLGTRGPLDPSAAVSGLGIAEVARAGEHATVVATQLMRQRTLDAAAQLHEEGIELEVIDPRTLVPFDAGTVGASVRRTGHLVCVQECPNFGSWGASVVAQVVADEFDYLDGPPLLVGADPTPVPYARNLEEAWIPSVERITDGIRRAL
jgi:acetoin:2,6-dichlorophenolindophenol oxidoreductase subunit beta